ncbi:MAG: ABC transporter permease [Paenibacillaceae bacterium]|nr:ABC transporter permease [Paenibacillaceae bacterium]
MKAYWQLTLAQLRLFGRNRQVMFWSLLFPIVFMIMLGTFFGKGGSGTVDVVVIDKDGTAASQSFVQALQQTKVAVVTLRSDESKSLDELRRGDREIVVIVPQGYETAVNAKSGEARIRLYYDDTDAVTAQLGQTAVDLAADSVSKQLTGYKPIVTVQAEGVQSLHLKYMDFLVPGIVGMMIMSNNLNGVAAQIASWRERGILRRLQSTPLRSSTFIAAQITARLLLNASQAVIVLLVGSLGFGTNINGSWWLLLSFVIVGTLAFMAIGFIIASLARNPESAGPISGFISFPLMFLGGVFFPVKNLPDWLQALVKLIPITHLTTGLRQVMNVGAGVGTLWPELTILAGWTIVAFAVSAFTFRWE